MKENITEKNSGRKIAEENVKRSFDWKNLGIRVLGAAAFLLVMVPAWILGGWFWFAAMALVSLLGTFEFYRAFKIEKTLSGAAGFLSSVIYLAVLGFFPEQDLMPFITLGFLLTMSAYVFSFKSMDAERALASFGGFFYLTVMASYQILIRRLDGGFYLLLFTAVASWGCDVFAYLFGMALGKHKMSPVLSPKKSVEGAVGGVLGSTVVSGILAFCLKGHLTLFSRPVLACMAVTFAASLLSMVGDLLASAFKRHRNIKDYSHLIPGHGGVLDRVDSFIFIGPVIYYLALVFMR